MWNKKGRHERPVFVRAVNDMRRPINAVRAVPKGFLIPVTIVSLLLLGIAAREGAEWVIGAKERTLIAHASLVPDTIATAATVETKELWRWTGWTDAETQGDLAQKTREVEGWIGPQASWLLTTESRIAIIADIRNQGAWDSARNTETIPSWSKLSRATIRADEGTTADAQKVAGGQRASLAQTSDYREAQASLSDVAGSARGFLRWEWQTDQLKDFGRVLGCDRGRWLAWAATATDTMIELHAACPQPDMSWLREQAGALANEGPSNADVWIATTFKAEWAGLSERWRQDSDEPSEADWLREALRTGGWQSPDGLEKAVAHLDGTAEMALVLDGTEWQAAVQLGVQPGAADALGDLLDEQLPAQSEGAAGRREWTIDHPWLEDEQVTITLATTTLELRIGEGVELTGAKSDETGREARTTGKIEGPTVATWARAILPDPAATIAAQATRAEYTSWADGELLRHELRLTR